MAKKNYDFIGWATKNDLLCSDGRVIRRDAFADDDGKRVSLVWMHDHSDPRNILGYADLKNTDRGVRTGLKFNLKNPRARYAKWAIEHGDFNSLSIYANKLVQDGRNVLSGAIKEVSLVLSGANPGAHIDPILSHGSESEDEAIIYTGEEITTVGRRNRYLSHEDDDYELDDFEEDENEDDDDFDDEYEDDEYEDDEDDDNEYEDDEPQEIGDVLSTLNDEQLDAVASFVGDIMEQQDAENYDNDDEYDDDEYDDIEDDDLDDYEEDDDMKHNAFDEYTDSYSGMDIDDVIAHSDMVAEDLCAAAIDDIDDFNGSFTKSFLAHAEQDYGIQNIDLLFPDAKNLDKVPQFIKREMAWVKDVMSSTTHVPFSRIRTMIADITEDDARARGYMKGNMKKEEFFPIAKRETTPQTVYKKQKLDRDDLLDATTMDVVNWLWGEMRLMLNEELARAYLIGDGRDASSQDKIHEAHIRPVLNDVDLFTVKENVSDDAWEDPAVLVEEISKKHKNYKGTGSPTFYTTVEQHTNMLWIKDTLGRRIYTSDAELCSALRVSKIVEVPVMEGLTQKDDQNNIYDVIGIKVNLSDYRVGTDAGGDINSFTAFDIDFNQNKYLLETRCSGALVVPYSAQVFRHKRA